MGAMLDIVFAIIISGGIGMVIYYFFKNIIDKKKSEPVFGLSYSGEYTQKNFWTNEIVIFAIITQGYSFLKLSLIVNIMMLCLILMLIFLYFTQIWRGSIGKNGIVSAKHFYEWRQVDSVEWITGLQAENPGYPSWGLVRFHTGSLYVEFIIKKKAEEEVRSFVEEKMNFAKAN
ncbi:hypothetical protein ACFW35_15255 [Fictibacillus sp. NPDC058756]|uniref:hypothetical protein n=1 Tax=Fictibacillus sp. NPDC058756 TaxID=3346625 RepID=UPI00369E088B